MIDLREKFESLDDERKRRVQFRLCAHALEVLGRYFAETGEIVYVESVVGTVQKVDPALPSDAFRAGAAGRDDDAVDARYAEPLAALQDGDIPFPDHIELAFYSIYNLFEKYVRGRAIDDWLIVNQALAAETEAEKWPVLLASALGEKI
jgi:hypothetical protein